MFETFGSASERETGISTGKPFANTISSPGVIKTFLKSFLNDENGHLFVEPRAGGDLPESSLVYCPAVTKPHQTPLPTPADSIRLDFFPGPVGRFLTQAESGRLGPTSSVPTRVDSYATARPHRWCLAGTDVEKEGLTREALYFGIDGLVKVCLPKSFRANSIICDESLTIIGNHKKTQKFEIIVHYYLIF